MAEWALGSPSVASTFGFYFCRILGADHAPYIQWKLMIHVQKAEEKSIPYMLYSKYRCALEVHN